MLVEYYNREKDGYIDFVEFLNDLRGRPSPKRLSSIDKAFLKFDKDGFGNIDIRDLKGVFNASLHPKVVSGEITEDQAFGEFLKNFSDRCIDSKISKAVRDLM